MNSTYLGDALDHWKGSIFRLLAESSAVTDLAADPMLTDPQKWHRSDFEIYARLLAIETNQIVPHRHSLEHRRAYFDEITHPWDLFLDPDVGIATGRLRKGGRHVRLREVENLLAINADRLIIVYQHIRGCTRSIRIDKITSQLTPSCQWSSYESGTVAMLFVSRQASRIRDVCASFRNLLGSHADGRVRSGRCGGGEPA